MALCSPGWQDPRRLGENRDLTFRLCRGFWMLCSRVCVADLWVELLVQGRAECTGTLCSVRMQLVASKALPQAALLHQPRAQRAFALPLGNQSSLRITRNRRPLAYPQVARVPGLRPSRLWGGAFWMRRGIQGCSKSCFFRSGSFVSVHVEECVCFWSQTNFLDFHLPHARFCFSCV